MRFSLSTNKWLIINCLPAVASAKAGQLLMVMLASWLIYPQTALSSSWSPTLLVNTEAFHEIDDTDTTSNKELRFGSGVTAEQLYLDINNNLFNFTDDVHAEGNLTASGNLVIGGTALIKNNTTVRGTISGSQLEVTRDANTTFIQFNDSTNGDSIGMFTGISNPDGTVSAQIGSLYLNNATGTMYKKQGDDGGTGGWEELAINTGSFVAQMSRAAAQSIPNNTNTKIAFDTEEYDIGNMADAVTNDRFDIRMDGRYLVTATLSLTNLDNNDFLDVQIHVNGSAVYETRNAGDGNNAETSTVITEILNLTSGDFVEMFVQHNQGGNLNTETGLLRPRMSVGMLNPVSGGGGGSDGSGSLLTQSQGDARYVNVSGDTMSGMLTVDADIFTNDNFNLNANDSATDAVLTFGNALGAETLLFSNLNSRFEFSDDIFVASGATISGSLLVAGTMSGGDIQCNNCLGQEDIGTAAIGTDEIKSATSSFSASANANVTMNDYSFFPNVDRDLCNDASVQMRQFNVNTTDDTVGRFRLQANTCGGNNYVVRWRYITSSDRPAIWAIVNADDTIAAAWQAEDPVAYPSNPNPLEGTELGTGQRFVYLDPLTVSLLDTLIGTLPAGDQSGIMNLLANYIVNKRGWLSSMSSMNDMSNIDPRYEPAARLWATRMIAAHYSLDPTEIITQTLDASSDVLALKSNYYTTLQNYIASKPIILAQNAAADAFSASLPIEVQKADLAEVYLSLETDIRSGDVVRIADIGPGYVTRTNSGYDLRAFGVVSTDPAFTMGEEIQSSSGQTVYVAVAGRVPVTVTTANGNIGTGDLLTSTSTTTGAAVRATANGQVLGQALQAFSGAGTGSILMFVKPMYYSASSGGSGGGSTSITQLTGSLVSDVETVFTHSSDADYKRIVDVYHQTAETSDITNFNVLDAESGSWILENPSTTEINGNAAKLIANGTVTPTSNNISIGATAIASDTTRSPALANDNNVNSFWYNQGTAGSSTRWWGIQLGSATQIISGSIEWFSSTYTADFRVQGSSDGNNWVTLGTFSHNGGGNQAWTLSSPATYQYYRYEFFNFTNATYTVLDEGRFFEATGGPNYSTTPVYVRNGAGKQISTGNWSAVNTTNVTDSVPANTDTRYLFSFDNATTWKAFSGGNWLTRTLTNIENDGMTTAQVEALSSANWFDTGGINSAASQTLDLAVSLDTNDSNFTPAFDSLILNISTQPYWQQDTTGSGVQIRLISPTQTSVKNLKASTFDHRINIILP